jgi:hypothetical protein
MDLKELDNVARQQDNRAKKHQKVFDENPGTLIIFYEDGLGVTKSLEEFEMDAVR